MQEHNSLKSPLTLSEKVTEIKKIDLSKVVSAYSQYNIDVQKYFGQNKNISLFQCDVSKYRFYHPLDAAGDSSFYEHFQQYDWYYMPWKWEHKETMDLVQSGDSVLEVGCGEGAFLKKVCEQKGVEGIGLELNENTAIQDQEGWSIVNESIEDFSEEHKNEFDIVCSFQVLEHIVDVRSFLEAKVKCLKPGGKLVICVPNNDSYIRHYFNCLNTPPHHMGLWNEESLKSLSEILDLSAPEVLFEPLQEHQVPGYVAAKVHAVLHGRAGEVAVKLLRKTGISAIRENQIRKKSHLLHGHSIMAIYTKKTV